MKQTLIFALSVCAWCMPTFAADVEPQKPIKEKLTRQLMFSAAYLKQTTDGPWHVRIVGDLPRGPGICMLIYNEAGDFVKRADIPWGKHSDEEPFIVTMPADGKAQQYVIKMLGQQDNFNGIRLPLTNLPYEVYGDHSFAFGNGFRGANQRLVAFQPNADGKPIHFSGWSDHYRILDAAGYSIADSKDLVLPEGDERKTGGPRNYEMITTLEPGKTYWIDPYRVMYLGVKHTKLYLTFDPESWFEPNLSWTLESRPWWKGTVNVD